MRYAVTLPMICSYAAIAAVSILPKYKDQIWDWRDYTAIAGVVLLLWFLTRRRTGLESPDGHEDTRNLVAFRLGQSLNRVRRRFSR